MEPTKGLKELRKYRDLTQEELADRVGVSGDTISKIERGQRMLKPELAEKIAPIFDLHPLELRLMNSLSIAKEKYEELEYQLEDSGHYFDPGKAETFVSDTWYSLAILTSDVASARVNGEYENQIGKHLKNLYQVAFEIAKLANNNRNNLSSMAGRAEQQPPYG